MTPTRGSFRRVLIPLRDYARAHPWRSRPMGALVALAAFLALLATLRAEASKEHTAPSESRAAVMDKAGGTSGAGSAGAALGSGPHQKAGALDATGEAAFPGAAIAQAEGPRKVRELSPGWVSAEHAVVIDGASGQVLWARAAHVPVPPASLTKIVTVLVALDRANLTDRVVVRVDSGDMPDSTVMGLSPGEELTVEDLLYGLMLPSGNDAAVALAEHISGTQEAFAQLMNQKVRSLGLTGSHFLNPHGLDAEGHISTAYDAAMLARAGMRNATFRRLASARTYETPRGQGYRLGNLNQLLWRYPGADGVKIGYTDAAGRTIVGSATRDEHRVFVAMMRSADIYADSAALLDWAFASYAW